MLKTILTIDPGKAGTGYAFWSMDKFKSKHLNYPIEAGILFNKDTSKQLRMFRQLLMKYYPYNVYIEDASFMYSNARTQAAANTGSLVTLAEYIGEIVAICKEFSVTPKLISVAQWKGTLSKEIVWMRVLRKLPKCNAKSHAQDAVALGLYLQGHINQGKVV